MSPFFKHFIISPKYSTSPLAQVFLSHVSISKYLLMEGKLEDEGEQIEAGEAFSLILSMRISGWLRRGKLPVEPQENPGQSVIGHSLPGCARGGFLGGMPGRFSTQRTWVCK